MKKIIPAIALILVSLGAAAQEAKAPADGAPGNGKVLATIGPDKVAITLEDLNALIEQYPPQFRSAFNNYERKKALLDSLIDTKLLAMASEKEKLDQDPQVQRMLRDARERILSFSYMRRLIDKIEISDEEAQKYYEAHMNEFAAPEMVKARHILLKDEAEANRLKDQLDSGADFEEMARQKSADPATAPRGGDLGWVTRGRFVPEFEQAVFNIEKGQIVGPVKTTFGYHIILLEDKRPRQQRSFEESKETVVQKLKEGKARELEESVKRKLREEYSVVLNEQAIKELLGAESQAVPAAPVVAAEPKVEPKKEKKQ